MVNLRPCGVQSPFGPSGPLHSEGKQQDRRGGGLGNLFCIFPLLFLSHSYLPTHSSPPFSNLTLSIFVFVFFFCLFARNTFSHICPWRPAASPFVVVVPSSLASPVPPCLKPFNQAYMFPSLPSFRTLSPCHFLFPVHQLPFFLFLCYQNGQVP